MHEDILTTIVGGDETKSLDGVEELNSSSNLGEVSQHRSELSSGKTSLDNGASKHFDYRGDKCKQVKVKTSIPKKRLDGRPIANMYGSPERHGLK